MKTIPINYVSKNLILINILVTMMYISWWINPNHIGNPYLYALLFVGELYHVLMSFLFWHTIWPKKEKKYLKKKINPSVDIFVTVAGEDVDIVKMTVEAARNIDYEKKKIYILNDGYVAKKDNWKDIENLSNELGVFCITRKNPGGAKAGNINNALRQTSGDIVVIFDADMAPHPDFLKLTIPYFSDPQIGFVQSPQYYKNNDLNEITRSSWEQQEFFFGPVMSGKNNHNASFICGTNVAIRRKALVEAGGMREDNIAEDFLTSVDIHKNGWKSIYIDTVLAEGLAPEDLLSYFKQQHRWARGSLEVLFSNNPIFSKKLTVSQKLQYISSALYYLNGLVVLIDITMPVIYFFTGVTPVAATTTAFALYFVPFIFLNLYTLYSVSQGRLSFRAISFSISSFTLQLLALKSIFLRRKASFAVTPKKAQSGNFVFLAYPHIIYAFLVIVGTGVAIYREGISTSVAANVAWGIFNVCLFLPYIFSSFHRSPSTMTTKITPIHQ